MERNTVRLTGERSRAATVRGALATVGVFVGLLVAASYPWLAGAAVLGAAGTLAGQRAGAWFDERGRTGRSSRPPIESRDGLARR